MMNSIKRLLILSGLMHCIIAMQTPKPNGTALSCTGSDTDEKQCEKVALDADKEFRRLRKNIISQNTKRKLRHQEIQREQILSERLTKSISTTEVDRNHFVDVAKLGEGSFGEVSQYQYTDPKSNIQGQYAIKTLKEKGCKKEKNGVKLQKIVSDSPFINKIVKTFEEGRFFSAKKYEIVMELGLKQSFNHLMKFNFCGDHRARTAIGDILWNRVEASIKFYAACLVCAIEKMHSNDIVHRDLKPENLIINPRNGYLQVTDFGTAVRFKGKVLREQIGMTPRYFSPEIAQDGVYGNEVDWWAFGVILYQMLAHCNYPFGNDLSVFNNAGVKLQILEEAGYPGCIGFRWDRHRPLSGVSDKAKDLIEKLLTKDITTRLKNGELDLDLLHVVEGAKIVYLNHDICIDKRTEVYIVEKKYRDRDSDSVKFTIQTKTMGGYPIKLAIDIALSNANKFLKYKQPLLQFKAIINQPIKVNKGWLTIRETGKDVLVLDCSGQRASIGDVKVDNIELIIPTNHPILQNSPKNCVGQKVRSHAWFKDFDWALLESGKYPAPWMPLSVGVRAKVRPSLGLKRFTGLEKDSVVIVDKMYPSGDVDCHIEGHPENSYTKERGQAIPERHLETIFTPWFRKCGGPAETENELELKA